MVYDSCLVSIDAFTVALDEKHEVLKDVIELYLLLIGFLRRTKCVREITEQACKHRGTKSHKK
jgi:Holliday junction resolvasome RuvABC ATP-dependent DNA helicase subunit